MTEVNFFEKTENGEVSCFTLKDTIQADVASFGATLLALRVPDRKGNLVNVALGVKNIAQLQNNSAYLGAFVGRCANRIANGSFCLKGKKYFLAKNDNGKNHLHGGNCGFNKKTYKAKICPDSVEFVGFSPDGEENYPANLTYSVKYTVRKNVLVIDYFALSDGLTLFNPTSHIYFNLNGEGNGDILDNVVQINAKHFLPVDENLIPTGEKRKVRGTEFDFTRPKAIGRDLAKGDSQLLVAQGYDHNFCLCGRFAALAYSPETGICVRCYTDRPGLQFYSGNFLQQSDSGYCKHGGFCFETQCYPDSINKKQWKSPLIHGGRAFHSRTGYVFSTLK